MTEDDMRVGLTPMKSLKSYNKCKYYQEVKQILEKDTLMI